MTNSEGMFISVFHKCEEIHLTLTVDFIWEVYVANLTSIIGLRNPILKLRLWRLTVAILVFLEPEVLLFGQEGRGA